VDDHIDKLHLVDKDTLLLRAVDHCEVLADREFLPLLLVPEDSQVLLEGGGEALKELLVDELQLLQGQVLQTQGPGLNYARDVVLLDVESEDLNELEHLGVELLVVDLEVTGLNVHLVLFLRC